MEELIWLQGFCDTDFSKEEFKKLFFESSKLDMKDYVEEKNGFSYISWINAWKHFVDLFPDATYSILRNAEGGVAFGNSTNGYMVYTSVKANGKTLPMWLPVMDFKNKSMLNPTSMDFNKAVMRCLVKNIGMFGVGWYVYAGEDLPFNYDDICKWSDEQLRNELSSNKIVMAHFEKQKLVLEEMPRDKLIEYTARMFGVKK